MNNILATEWEVCLLALNKVANKFGHGPIEFWRTSDYEQLSQQLLEKSGVQLNSKTLRILFKKVQDNEPVNPQNSTKAAIAAYLGFEDWSKLRDEFLKEVPVQEVVEQEPKIFEPNSPLSEPIILERKNPRRISGIGIGLFLILLTAITIFFFTPHFEDENETQAYLEISDTEGIIPFSTKISYQLKGDLGDSSFLQFAGLPIKRRIRDTFPHELIQSFYLPDIHKISIERHRGGRKEILALKLLFGYHPDWWVLFYSSPKVPEVLDAYETPEGTITVDYKDDFVKQDNAGKYPFVHFKRVMPYNIGIDSVNLFLRFKNKLNSKVANSKDLILRLESDSGVYHIATCAPGYESWWGWTQFNDQELNDVSQTNYFIIPTNDWVTLQVKSLNKKGYVILNGKEPFNFEFKNRIGKLKAIKVMARGYGEIDTIALSSFDNQLLYSEGFSSKKKR